MKVFAAVRAFAAAALLAAAALAASCASSPSTAGIPAVANFDRAEFAGRWYEISRIPIPVARDWVGTADVYVPNGDGTWTVRYEGFKGGFDGKPGVMKQQLKIKDPQSGPMGEMLAKPFPLLWLPYRLIDWDRASGIMLVTSSSLDFLWILCKDPLPPRPAYEAAVARAAAFGFDVARLEEVPQRR
jgi:apolipoprotein D and lipocalin family protein